MRSVQTFTDKFAISLSLLCALHCLALPLVLTLLPGLTATQLDSELFHVWMVVAVVPTSIYALTLGCTQHNRYSLFILGVIGLSLLMLALLLGEDRIGEFGEKALTLLGAVFVATGHWLNYRHCRAQEQAGCDCSSDKPQPF